MAGQIQEDYTTVYFLCLMLYGINLQMQLTCEVSLCIRFAQTKISLMHIHQKMAFKSH